MLLGSEVVSGAQVTHGDLGGREDVEPGAFQVVRLFGVVVVENPIPARDHENQITRPRQYGQLNLARRASMKRVSLLLLVGIVVLVGLTITIGRAFQVVSQVVTFDESLGQLPESIAIDKRGNIYVSFF